MSSRLNARSRSIQLLQMGVGPGEVARRVGVSASYVRRIKRELEAGIEPAPRGRPRKTTHPAEACARMVEDIYKRLGTKRVELDEIAECIRGGLWKEYV